MPPQSSAATGTRDDDGLSSRSASRHWVVRHGPLLAIGAALVALYAPTAIWLWGRWTMSVWHNAHGALVPPVVAYLIYGELKATRGLPTSASAWGFALLIPALILQIADTGMHTELLSAVSLVLILPGLSLLLLGVERTRRIAFPLAFMVFALPIPLSLTERLHLVLRHVATDATAALTSLAGIPVFAEGTTLHLPETDLGIADACSGFSTLYAAAAVACLTAWLADTWQRRLLVLVSAAPLAIAANILRVVLLVVVVEYTGTDVLETWIHPASGMLTFALALPVIMWLGQSARAVHAPSPSPAADAAKEPAEAGPAQ
jgi:exosortase